MAGFNWSSRFYSGYAEGLSRKNISTRDDEGKWILTESETY